METFIVFTDPNAPTVELWQVGGELQIRNGKRGRPEFVETRDGMFEEAASAFFQGYNYAKGI